ncbi:hypothetical protein IBK_1366 [Dehalococcoides mccartyi IBARAKI]|jgi:hypothetical protein|nr:hypothetical protein IBK_1366 [Dehalococcoides mccartyi IBARAKI]
MLDWKMVCSPKIDPGKVRLLWDNHTMIGGVFHEEFTVFGGASSLLHEAG